MNLIQIGNTIINLDQVTHVDLNDGAGRVKIYLSVSPGWMGTPGDHGLEGEWEQSVLYFSDDKADALRRHFAQHATRLPISGTGGAAQ